MLKPWRRKLAWQGTILLIVILSILLFLGIAYYINAYYTFSNYIINHYSEISLEWEFDSLTMGYTYPIQKRWIRNSSAMGIVFTALGIAGTVVPAVYNSRERKIKGILIEDMTTYFFPHYGLIMVLNLLLSLAGQITCAVDCMVSIPFFLIGDCLSVTYSLLLVLATGLSPKITKQFIKAYILDHIATLEIEKGQMETDELRIKRSRFLNSLSSHIAEQSHREEMPFCFTDQILEDELREVTRIITYHTRWSRSEFEEIHSFIDSFDTIFQFTEDFIDEDACRFGIYFELPMTDDVRDAFAIQIESAYEFWKIALGSISNSLSEAKAACRILCALAIRSGELYDNYVVMSCGLMIYLYKKYHSNMTDNQDREVEQCAVFIDHMVHIFRSESQFSSNRDILLKSTLRICGDLLFTLWTISEVEAYCSQTELSNRHIHETFDRWYFCEQGFSNTVINRESAKLYLCYGCCIIKQLPSVARKILTMDQKHHLEEYVLTEMSSIFN